MVYILEAKLFENKKLHIALEGIYGIGSYHSNNICKNLGFSKNLKLNEISESQLLKIVRFVEKKNILTGTDLKQNISTDHKKLENIKSYRGLRKISGLPIRGQRTHTNARSARKKRR